MQKLEYILKIISRTLGTIGFSFLFSLMLIYRNFPETTAFILGGVMMVLVLIGSYFFGPYFLR